MKRTIIILLCLSLAVGFVFAGTNKDTSPGTVTLRMSWWGGDSRHEATLNAIEKFEAKYPNIDVKAEYTGWDGHLQKVTTQLGGGTAPDVMQINWNWLVLFSKSGTGFYDLNKVAAEVGLDNYTADYLKYVTIDGKVNGLPVSLTGREFYWNKETFEMFGAEYPKTWDELFALGAKFGEGYYPLDLSEQDAILLGSTYVEQKTGRIMISPDGQLEYTLADFEELLGFYKKLQDMGVTEGIKVRNAEGGGRNAPLHQMQKYLQGKFAGVLTWDSAYAKYANPLAETNQTLELGSLPIMDGAKSKGWIVKPSMLFCINKDTKYPKEAAMLINFLLNDPDGVKALGLSRSIPVSKSAYNTLVADGLIKGVAVDGLQLALANAGRGYSPYLENPQIAELTYQAIEDLAYETDTVANIAKRLYDNVKATLDKVR